MGIEIPIPNSDRLTGEYIAVAGQTEFDFDFPIFHETHLLVRFTRDGVENNLTLDTDYTVAIDPATFKGKITLTVPAIAGDLILIIGNTPYQRVTDFTTRGQFTANVINTELDLMEQQIQQLARMIGQALLFDYGSSGAFLPDAAESQLITFDDTGTAVLIDAADLPVNGKDGLNIHLQDGPPDDQFGRDGEGYIDRQTTILYTKEAGAWQAVGTLQGPVGPAPSVVNNGNGSYTLTSGVQSVTWYDGAPGLNTYASGSNPANGDGVDGESWINTVTKELFWKIGGVWTSAGLLKGDPGPLPSLTDNGDGTYTIATANESITLKDGAPAAPPSLIDNGNGSYIITNGLHPAHPDFDDMTFFDGETPTLTDNGDGTYTIATANESITVKDGAPPTLTDNGDGTKTISTPTQSITVFDGETGPQGPPGAYAITIMSADQSLDPEASTWQTVPIDQLLVSEAGAITFTARGLQISENLDGVELLGHTAIVVTGTTTIARARMRFQVWRNNTVLETTAETPWADADNDGEINLDLNWPTFDLLPNDEIELQVQLNVQVPLPGSALVDLLGPPPGGGASGRSAKTRLSLRALTSPGTVGAISQAKLIFRSVSHLKGLQAVSIGQVAQTINYSVLGDGWGATYVAVDDGTHTDGAGGWVEGANYLQGAGIQWELLSDSHGRYSLGQMGLYDGVDASARLNNLNGSAHIRNIYAPAGTMVLNADVTLSMTNFDWRGEGRNTVIDCSGGGSLLLEAAFSVLPGVSAVSPINAGDTSVEFITAHGLLSDDVFVVHDPNPSSFSPFRTNYQDGHIFRVAAVNTSTNVEVFGHAVDSYNSAALEVHKFEGQRAEISGFHVIPRTIGGAALAVKGYGRLVWRRMSGPAGAADTLFSIISCYDFDVDLTEASAYAGNAYPLILVNCQKGTVRGMRNYSFRHCVGLGGGGGGSGTAAVPNRDIVFDSLVLHNLNTSGIPANDIHGNSDRIKYVNCVVNAMAGISGRNISYENCHIDGRAGSIADGVAVAGSEPIGGHYSIRGCTIDVSGSSTSFGTFSFPMALLTEKATVLIKDCFVRNYGSGPLGNWRLVNIDLSNTSQDIDVIVDNVTVEASGLGAGIRYNGETTGTLRTALTNFTAPSTPLVSAQVATVLEHPMRLQSQTFSTDFVTSPADMTNNYVSNFVDFNYIYPRQPSVLMQQHATDGAVSYNVLNDGILTYPVTLQGHRTRPAIQTHDGSNFQDVNNVRVTSRLFIEEW